MVSELVLFQLSSFCALVGMTLGWRGVMTKYAGFYDLPTAWNQVFWGIVLGGVYAVMADGMLFRPYYTTVLSEDSVYTGLNIFSPHGRRVVCFRFFPPPSAQKTCPQGWFTTNQWVGPWTCHRRYGRDGHDVSNV